MGILEEEKIENKSGRVTTPGRNYSVFFILFFFFVCVFCFFLAPSTLIPSLLLLFSLNSSCFLSFFLSVFCFLVVAVCVLPLGLAGRD